MDVSVKKMPRSRAEIAVSIPWDEWKTEIDHAAEHLARDVKIEGFRPGKAPRAMLEKRLGKATILVEGAEHAIDHLYPAALEKSGIEAIGRPEVRLENVKEGEALSFVVETAVIPDITLKPWKKKVQEINKKQDKEKVEVSEAEIDAEVAKLAESRAKFVTVLREARQGDMVEVDFEVTMGGVPIEGGTGKKHPIVLGKGAFIPGFEEAILGLSAGEEKSVELSFPDQYHMKSLAGKPATFWVKVLLVQEREIPVVDDAFAASLGAFESVAALRKNMADGLRVEREQEAKEKRRVAILEAIVEEAEAELPEVLVESELRRMIAEFGRQASMMGMELGDYLARLGKTEEELAKDWRPQAEKRIRSGLALESIAWEEDIAVDQSEIEEEMNKALAYFKSVKQAEKDVDLAALYDAAKSRLRNEKLFQTLEKI